MVTQFSITTSLNFEMAILINVMQQTVTNIEVAVRVYSRVFANRIIEISNIGGAKAPPVLPLAPWGDATECTYVCTYTYLKLDFIKHYCDIAD